MSIKKIGNGVYADIEKKYAICRAFDGEWNVYKCIGRIDNVLQYHCTYKYLADAKKYVEQMTNKTVVLGYISHD